MIVEKIINLHSNMTEHKTGSFELKSMCTKFGLKLSRRTNPVAILLLHVEVVRGVHSLLHASPVPGDPALDGDIPGGRTQRKLLQILH